MNTYKDELRHHGIKGQKWGVRRYQNTDGSLTSAGRERYNTGQITGGNPVSRIIRDVSRKNSARARERSANKAIAEAKKAQDAARKEKEALEKTKAELQEERKKLLEYKESPEYKAKLQKETEMAKLSNEALAAKIRAIDLERQYEALVHPKPMTKPKKTAMERTKEIIALAKDISVLTLSIGKVGNAVEAALDKDKKKD